MNLLDYLIKDKDYPPYKQPKPIDTGDTSGIGMVLGTIGYIVLAGLIIGGLVKLFKGYGRKVKGAASFKEKAENIGVLMMQKLTDGRGSKFRCSKCNMIFPNWSRDKYKVVDTPKGKYSIYSNCCEAICNYMIPFSEMHT